MKKLPDYCIPVNYLALSTADVYFDTGIKPSSDLKINGLFHMGYQSDVTVYMFGARDNNSNTSPGQIEIECVNGVVWVGYDRARQQGLLAYKKASVQKNENIITLYSEEGMETLTGSTNVFEGTRNMLIFARNNGGAVQTGTTIHGRGLYALQIEKNGELLIDYAPCYNENEGRFGIYDYVSETFILPLSVTPRSDWDNAFGTFELASVRAEAETHGQAYIITNNAGYTNEILVAYSDSPSTLSSQDNKIFITAIANEGYEFHYWENYQTGEKIYERETEVSITQETTMVAHFQKKTTIDEKNGFKALGLQYGVGNSEVAFEGQKSNIYSNVLEATIKEDIMSKTTSTILLKDIPTTYQNSMPLLLFNSKGKLLYAGTINSVDGNTVYCREPLSIVDRDYLFKSASGRMTINEYVSDIAERVLEGQPGSDTLGIGCGLAFKRGLPYNVSSEKTIWFESKKNYTVFPPSIDSPSIKSAEGYIMELANDFLVYFKPYIIKDAYSKKILLGLRSINPYMHEGITLGSNLEEISNIQIEKGEMEATMLTIFDENYSNERATFLIRNDGSIEKRQYKTITVDEVDYLATNNCIWKLVASKQPLETLVAQNLSNGMFNHKITFNVDLTKNTFNFDDFELGRLVDFYDGDKLYKSIITAREYSLKANSGIVENMKVTMGKVRNDLTTKLNLGKVK